MKVCRNSDVNASKKLRRDRLEVAQKVVNIKDYLEKTGNQTKAALAENVPRTTLQYWIKCDEIKTGLPQEVEIFFKSPIGMAYLHRLVMAAQFSITQLGSAGIEVWREFLHLGAWGVAEQRTNLRVLADIIRHYLLQIILQKKKLLQLIFAKRYA